MKVQFIKGLSSIWREVESRVEAEALASELEADRFFVVGNYREPFPAADIREADRIARRLGFPDRYGR